MTVDEIMSNIDDWKDLLLAEGDWPASRREINNLYDDIRAAVEQLVRERDEARALLNDLRCVLFKVYP